MLEFIIVLFIVSDVQNSFFFLLLYSIGLSWDATTRIFCPTYSVPIDLCQALYQDHTLYFSRFLSVLLSRLGSCPWSFMLRHIKLYRGVFVFREPVIESFGTLAFTYGLPVCCDQLINQRLFLFQPYSALKGLSDEFCLIIRKYGNGFLWISSF